MPPEAISGHVFVSYVHEDAVQVDALVAFLEAYGLRVWRDKDQLWPGDDWKIEIRRAIQRSALGFVACFSEASNARERTYQNEELVLAVEEYRLRRPGIPWLFPVRFGDVELPPYDLGAGKTLDALQRTDLYGETREPNLGRLAASITRVISSGPAAPGAGVRENGAHEPGSGAQPLEATGGRASNPSSPAARMKSLLRDPTKDIKLDDYLTALADEARSQCLDPARFPTSSERLTSNDVGAVADLVIERCDDYWQIMEPVCEALAVGCAWGTREHDALWARTMRTLANTTPVEGGYQILLDLRSYPRLMALYAASLGAVARENYSALRAVTTDAKHRKEGESIPVIGVCYVWGPFSTMDYLASAVARHTDGQPATVDEIRGFAQHSGGRLTPVSDDLHTRLRDPFRSLIPDDDDFDHAFDRAEVILGVVAEDNATVEKTFGRYAYGGWTGRYTWRGRYSRRNAFDVVRDEFTAAGELWPPLLAGLFGGKVERAESAFAAMTQQAHASRF